MSLADGGQVFATAEDKHKTAAAAFEGVERRYGSSAVGLRAKYYAAISRIALKQYGEAEKSLKDLPGFVSIFGFMFLP